MNHDLSYKAPNKRTRTIEFTRQLWPQPPKESKPYFCLMNTLCFIDPNDSCKAVWEQRVPEGLIKWDFDRKGVQLDSHRNIVHMDGPLDMRVEWDDTWGWLLKFYLTHQEADHLWAEMIRFRTKPYIPITPAYNEQLAEKIQFLEDGA